MNADSHLLSEILTLRIFGWRARKTGAGSFSRCAKLVSMIREARLPDGTMRVEEFGRDCDGVSYSGRIHRNIHASIAGLNSLYNSVGEWADGPFNLRPVPASEPDPVYASRDLSLEAFENGHPHILHTYPHVKARRPNA